MRRPRCRESRMVCAWCVVSGAPKKMTRMKTAGTVRVMVRMSERKAGYNYGQIISCKRIV